MPRLTKAERAAIDADFPGHYTQLLLLHPSFEIAPGYGLPQLRADIARYIALDDAIEAIEATGMPLKRAQRDALFGLSPEDANGIWYYLSLYKAQVRLKMLKGSAYAKTVPNLGRVFVGAYDEILKRFGEHWKLVNEALAAQTPPAAPLAIGPITLEELETRRAQINRLEAEVDETVLTKLAVMRAQREAFYGDVREDDREPTSLIARYELYRLQVQSDFAGSPLAQTLPRLFPDGAETLPRFDFNFFSDGAQVALWFSPPVLGAGIVPAVVYLKEGAVEETALYPSAAPFRVSFIVGVQGEVDEVEVRDGDGKTLAHGRYDATLPQPV